MQFAFLFLHLSTLIPLRRPPLIRVIRVIRGFFTFRTVITMVFLVFGACLGQKPVWRTLVFGRETAKWHILARFVPVFAFVSAFPRNLWPRKNARIAKCKGERDGLVPLCSWCSLAAIPAGAARAERSYGNMYYTMLTSVCQGGGAGIPEFFGRATSQQNADPGVGARLDP